jgi:alpha-tubulin suppressor-like RCC1 family protein/uncharacterized protein YpmS
LSFDGGSDYVQMPYNANLNPSIFTVSLWVKVEGNENVYRSPITSRNGSTITGYLIYAGPGNRWEFLIGSGSWHDIIGPPVVLNEWTHLAMTYNGTDFTAYINGEQLGSETASFVQNTTSPLRIAAGTTESTPSYYFNGKIDEVRIYNIALSQAEIQSTMCKRLSGNEDGLVAYYRFDNTSGTTLLDLAGGDYHGTLYNMDNSNWVTSGAALGDDSAYDYVGSVFSDFSASIAHADSDQFTATGDGGTYTGIHVYLINESPNSITIPDGYTSMDTDHYYGVFPVGITPTYSIAYNYSGNTYAIDDSNLQLAYRSNNAGIWTGVVSTQNISTNTVTKDSISAILATEFILGRNETPILNAIGNQTTNEDTMLTVTFTAYDAESSTLTVTTVSSNATLITNISYVSNGDAYTLTMIPEADQNGSATITVTVTDEGGLTAVSSFDVTVTPVNDFPILSSVTTLTTNEESMTSFALTATDLETATCSLNLTIVSSNTSLLPDDNISYTCAANIFYISFTPVANQSGNVTLTLTVTDPDSLSTTFNVDVSVLDINDPPQIGSIADQTTLEDIATSIISFSVTDYETAACNMTLSMTSSDQTLMPNEYLLSMCSGDQYSIVATPALNQSGTATISVTITDAGGFAASTSFVLTVTDVDDSQYIWANHQAADIVLGQSDFTSTATGATDSLFAYPTAVAVDSTTGKVFVCDRGNNRVLRFSAANAAINGSSAEAVLGQADFNSILANRGGSPAANTMNAPDLLIVDAFGRLWVTDGGNHRVLRFDNASSIANGSNADVVLGQPDFVTITSGTAQNKMNQPAGLWMDPAGRLWVAEKYNHRLIWFNNAASKNNGANADGVLGQSDFVTSTGNALINALNRPLDVVGDNAGNIFVCDANNHRIIRYDNAAFKENGGNADGVLGQTDFNSNGSAISVNKINYPISCIMDTAGRLYVGDINNYRVLIFNDAINKSNGADANHVLGQADFTTNVENSGGISERSIYKPHWIFFDTRNNHLWVADPENIRVLRYSLLTKTPPTMSLISDETIDEDTFSNSLSFTVTDINEQALTITYTSSNTFLISSNSITFSGSQVSTNGSDYTVSTTAVESTVTLSVTPENNENGNATIFITVTDPNGMTDTQSFILTVNPVNDTPVITANSTFSMNEDSPSSFTLTATDVETAECSLNITWHSSDISILPDEQISYTCAGDVLYFSLTPIENQSGNITLSITITDSGSLTATHALDVTVVDINDTPIIGTVANQSTDNRTALSAISITATDEETATCSMNLSLTSSDSNIFASSNMTSTCSANTFYMSFTPSMQYFGTTTITAMVTDAGGLTASTSFDIEVTSTGPNYAPVLGARVDRWMDINLRNANGIWVYDENHIFVVGSYGDIMHYDGERMTPMHSPVNKEWYSVWGTSPTNVYCVGADGKILHYNGRVWTQETSCTRKDLYEVWGFNANSVYVAGEDSDICHYTGTTWPMLTAPYNTYIRGIWGTSDANMYFADSYDVAISYDGSAWGLVGSIGSRNFHDAWGADASNIWFVGDNGNVQHYNGSTITDQTMGSTNTLYAIWGSDTNNVFALGQSGSVKYYNGSSWSEIGNNSELYKDAWGIDATHVYAVTTYGKIYKYTGTTFELDHQSIASNVYGIWANSDTDVYLSGYSKMHHFDGISWTEISANATSELNAVWSNGSIAWAVGDNGYVFYYDGSTLTRDTGITGSRLYDVWGSSANDVFAVGETGLIRHYNGSTWSVMSSGTTEHLKGVYGTASNNVIAVGENGTILRYNGSTWASESSGITESINGIWVNNASDIYVVGNNGSVLNYNGSTWQEFGKRSGQNLNGVWGNGSGDIYVVGNFGSILHYDGTLWNTTFTGESFDLYDISGYGDTVMLVGDYRTVKQLYDYNYSETISKSIAVNGSNEPIPIHLLDYNGDSMTISAVSSDQSILPDGNISITGTGTDRTILVSPLTDQYGTLTLTVSVDDGLSQTTSQIILTVSQPPVIASISPQSVPEDTVLNLSLPVSGTDADTCGLQVKAFSNDTDLIREMMTDCQEGNYTLTIRPVPAQNGVTTITVTAANTAGAYTEQSFSLTVTPVNDAPKIGISSDSWTAPLRGIKQIKAFSDGSVVAVNNCGKIYHYINQQWQLVPSGIFNNINTIWGQDSSSIYVGGYQGKIWHFDGSSWTTETTGISYEIFGIWGSASDDIFAVAQSGSIIHYDGSSWSEMNSYTTNYLYDVDGNDSNDVFACGQSGTIIHYDGSSWSAQTSGTSNNLNQILCMGTNAVFARGGYEILSYNGSTWSSYSTASTVQYLWGLSANDVYAVCGSGNIYHFDGSSWSEMTSFTSENLMSIWGRSATDIYVVTYEGSIFHYDGLNWTERPENLSQSYSHVTGTDNEVFAAGNYGIYKYNGINWTESSMDVFWERFINNTNAPVELKIMPDGRIIGANSSYFSQYDGNGWTVENTGWSVAVQDIWSDGTVIYIVGYAGTMIYYDGASWSKLTTGVTTDFYCIWGTRKDNIYLGSNYGLIYHYDGTTFTEIALDTPDTIHTIWGSGFSDIYAGSSYQKFFHYNGQEWQQMDSWISSDNAIFSIHGRHSRDIYLAGGGGGISYNNGFCWSPITTGTTGYFRTIWHQKADEIYAGGSSGLLAQSDGQSVTIIDPIVFDAYSDIDGSADYVIATGPHENLIRYASIISIPDQTFYADSLVHSIPIVVSDADGDSVTVSVTSSSLTLLNADSLSLSGSGSSYAILITPTVHSSLPITITVSAYDGSLTQNENFMLYLRKVNTPPELAIIPNIGTAAGEISFTFVETDGDTVSLTVTSSDQSLIADGNIQIVGGTGNTTILATSAYIEQNVTIQLNQESDVHGLATITVTASATGGTVTETFNVIVSPPGSGNALAFDGDDDFVTFGSISGSHPLALSGSQFSMSFWIKPAFNNSVSQRLIDKSSAPYGADGYSLYLYTGYRLKFALNGLDRFTTEENSLKPNLWQHVVITADASQYKCYVNGMTVGMTILDVFELPPNATANLYLGTWYSGSGREYNGEMDEVSLWNRALSETDIRDIMCQRLIGTENGLLAYYRFDHVSGAVLTDLSGNNYNGTLTNMDNTDWVTSGAALGDSSHYDYNGSVASDFSVSLSHSDGDAFTAFGDSGSYSGMQMYLVNESLSSYTAPAGFSTLYTDHYFGVFPVGMTPTYSVAYHYSGNTSIATDTGLRLAARSNNSSTWFDLSASLDQFTTTLSQTGISAFSGISTTEFIPGMNIEPIIGAIAPQTMNEDTIISSLAITATDAETSVCDLNIMFHSSDTALVPVDNISYTCSANTYYLSITPINNLTGVCEITITLTDAGGLTSSGTLALTVTDVNDAPLISTISDQTTIEDLAVGSISLTVSDLEDSADCMDITITSSDTVLIPNDNITYTCTSNTYWLTITPAADQNGQATITVTVRDSGDLTATYSFDLTITAVNDAPVLVNPIPNRIATEGTAYAYTVPSNTFVDVDSGDVLTYTATQENGSALPAWLSFDPLTRVFSGLPTNSDVGSITITITATDGSAQSITDTFVLSVNNTNSAPVLDYPIADQTTDEDVPYSFTFAADTFSDDDIAFGDTISYTAMLADGSPLPDWLTFDINNRHFSGTPTNDDAIVYTITVIASDTLNLTAEDSFYLTVVNINDAPVISVLSQDISLISDEDTVIQSMPLTATDLETATCSLDITFVSSNINLFSMDNISYTCNAETFYLSFTPALNQSGNAIISITVTDGSLSASTEFAFTINAVNDAPLLTGDSTVILDEDTSSSLSLTATDIETAGCSLNLTYFSSNTTLLPFENISYTCSNGNINVDFTPVGDQSGNTNLTFTVSDPESLSASHVVLITVNDINDSPQIDVISDQTIDEDTTLSAMKITVTDLETAGCSMGITFTSSDTDLIPVSNISYTCSANIFYLTLTPVAEQSGTSTITITITDDGYLTAIESFVFNVNEVYDMPGTRGNPYTITCIEELYNMRDDNIGAYYCLIKDLDFNDAASYNNPNDTSFGDINGNSSVEGIQTELTSGTGWTGDLFGGHLDGRFHIIKNLYINTTNYAGLFQSTNHGTVIQNLGIVDADITKVGGYGGVVASEIHSTTIENVFVTGILRSTDIDPNGRKNGGIAGYAVDGTSYINNCYSDVLIESNVNEDAGIVGFNGTTLTISNCLAKGNIPTGNGVGGIVGTHVGTLTIENSIAFMSQLTSGVVRRILANPAGGSYVLNNNYANSAMILNASTVTSTDTTSLEGKDLSSAQLTDASFYSTYLPSWDFDSVWLMTGSGPKLRGFYSNALYFTGADDGTSGTYVNLGAATHFNGLSELTCEAWVKPMSTKTWQEILHVQDNSGSVNAITFVLSSGHSLNAYINQTVFGCSRVVRIGQWNHVAYTWRSSDGQIILYVNGELVCSGTSSTSAVASGAGGNAYIGTSSGTTEFFDGSIDALRIWNSVRSQSEIQSSMFQECSGNETNLLACYQFNQGSGTDLPDLGPNAMHGTLMNMTDNNWVASAAMSPIITGTSQVSENSFYLSWQTLSDNDIQYYIDIDDNNDFSSPLVEYMAIGNGTDYTISNLGLDRTTPYYCRILKLGESGRSLYTEVQPFMVQTGKSLNFQSSQSEYVNIGNDDSLHLTSQITLEGWFKFTAVTNDQGLVMKQYPVNDFRGFGLQYYVNANPYFCFGLGDADSFESIYSVTTPVTNQWYHVAATYDGATIKIYVNGELESTRSYTGGFDGSYNNYDLVLGKFSLADAYYFNGQMDEIRIWDVALDQADIQANMYHELSGRESNLIAYYPFNNNTVNDMTLNHNDGTTFNMDETNYLISDGIITSSPIIGFIEDQTIDEDTLSHAISFTVADMESNASELILTVSISDSTLVQPANMVFSGTDENRTLTISPTADENGTATITIIATDPHGLTVSSAFALTVNEINDLPEISFISDAQMDEDTAISINFSISDTESDASSLTLSINSSNQTLVAPENISISGTGMNRTILIMPADSEYGIVDITVSVSDGDLTSTISFALTVTQINDAPVFEARSIIFIGNGEYHNYAIDNSGAVWGWGNNASNQITSETTLNQSYPIKISDLDNVISLAGGLEHSLALKSDGTVWAWGANAEGQLGDGTNSDKATPVQVLNLSNIIEIAANQNRSMALESDGTVWAWGNNTGGRLGDGTTTDRNEPVELTSLTNIVQISIGFNHNLALKNDNTVWAWGNNSNGELGDGTITDRSSPVEITAISNVIMVSAGRYFSIALLNDGTVMAWGENQAGQLGDASNLDRLTPVQVSGLTNVTFITAFSNFSHALKSDGSVWGWGNDTDGRLGDDSAANKNSPVQVLGLNDLMMISHGSDHSLSLSYDGTVRAWGTNDHGQLGDRTTLEKHIPTLVPIDVYAISIEEDSSHTIAEIITDVESSPCDLTLTLLSSDPVLFTNTNLTDTCNADTYTINITPTADMDGIATLTIIATDAEGLTSAKSLTVTVTPVNDTPVITSDVTFTMNEDATSILTLTATDAESADCSMDITFASSNTNLLPVENIAYTCASGVYHISIMPESNQSGNTTLTITITDSGSLTATQSIALTVLNVNDPPQMGSIADQTTLEDIATSVISFTVADNETASCSMTLSMTSSDTSLVPDEYLLSMCSGNEYSIVATPAFNQFGSATISVTITDSGGLSASTSFSLTVTDVDDSQSLWANFQAADVVLGQSDFISNTAGTSDSMFKTPCSVAVDPTTGKVFVSEWLNHRILRFSSTASTINGSSAEAVFGQANFTSGDSNRGGSVAANTLSGPSKIFIDSFGRLWVADFENHRVLRFDNASSKTSGCDADGVLGQSDFLSYTSGTTQNTMNKPWGLFVDHNGRLWVADSLNHRVLRFDNAALKSNGADADGVLGQSDFLTNTPGTTQSIMNKPADIFVDNTDTLFISETLNNRVLRFDNVTLKTNGANADAVLGQADFISNTNAVGASQMHEAFGLAMDGSGRLYVTDGENDRILIFNDAITLPNGAAASYVLGQPDFTSNTENYGGISERSRADSVYIFFDKNNNYLWTVGTINNRVLRYSMMTKTSPVISLISDSTMDEDTVSSAIIFTVTDINEQALTITYNSSDTSLISTSSITFSGDQVSTDGIAYTVSATAVPSNVTLIITPESNQSGTATITLTVTDPNGMTATQSFSLTVNAVNDVPTLSTINPQSMNEGSSIDITLTTSDIEGDALALTVVSSDQSLIMDGDILVNNDGNTYTITITPLVNQSGSTDITISVNDGTNLTSMAFTITVNEVYYMIAGHVSNYTDIAGSDLQGVTMTLSGTHTYSMVTDASGYYTFTTVRPGDYTLTASKSDDIHLEIANAITILKASVRKISLTCMEQIAADAYNDGHFGAYDASRVLDYLAGFENCMNDNCTFWQFATENITSCETWPLIEFENTRRYTGLTGDAVGQDFIGIGCGDVSE